MGESIKNQKVMDSTGVYPVTGMTDKNRFFDSFIAYYCGLF
jgi:hypothetical protein